MNVISRIKRNWQSGITVALVSVPLSISLAVASQTTPLTGIITAIWAGLIASLFAGSNFNIIGPTGALSGILATFALVHGGQALPMLALVTGALILVAYLLRVEKYLIFIPGSTIHGFTLGVACIIGLNQLNFALGLSGLPKHEYLIQNVIESFKHLQNFSLPALLCFLFFLCLLLLLLKWVPQLPAIITITPLGLILGYVSSHYFPHTVQTLGDLFGSISFSFFSFPHLHFESSMIMTGITLAFIAILETMISARIADGMTKTRHNARKELFALSIANIASGLAGGIPATAALARTALNVKNHATDAISATICSICIAIISFLFLPSFSYIPLAVIAAILVYVALRMIEAEHFYTLFHYDKINFFISLLVALLTIVYDPIIGILIGISLSLIMFAKQISSRQPISHESERANTHTLIYAFKGPVCYMNCQTHRARFTTNLDPYSTIILNLADISSIDMDGIDALNEIIEQLHTAKKLIILVIPDKKIAHLIKTNHRFRSLSDAIHFANTHA